VVLLRCSIISWHSVAEDDVLGRGQRPRLQGSLSQAASKDTSFSAAAISDRGCRVYDQNLKAMCYNCDCRAAIARLAYIIIII
jgi:hypothetical protein